MERQLIRHGLSGGEGVPLGKCSFGRFRQPAARFPSQRTGERPPGTMKREDTVNLKSHNNRTVPYEPRLVPQLNPQG